MEIDRIHASALAQLLIALRRDERVHTDLRRVVCLSARGKVRGRSEYCDSAAKLSPGGAFATLREIIDISPTGENAIVSL